MKHCFLSAFKDGGLWSIVSVDSSFMLVPANPLSCGVVGVGGRERGRERKNKLILTAGPRNPSLKILSSMA